MLDRRAFTLTDVGEIMHEVDRLLAGHERAGNWTLGQILDHLARSINLSLALPASETPPSREQAIARRLFFRAPAFPKGQTAPAVLGEPDKGADPSEAADALRAALDRLVNHAGPYPSSHPVLGPLTRQEWIEFHIRHAAHHLSFVVPD
jgi:hypothetical protein